MKRNILEYLEDTVQKYPDKTAFANEKMEIARRIGNMSYIHDARMNVAEVIGSQGMYKESLDYMGDVDKSLLDVYQIEKAAQ